MFDILAVEYHSATWYYLLTEGLKLKIYSHSLKKNTILDLS